jgi:CRP/FNR family transcriptional regulator, nitrogen fixation regulation protein
MYAINTASVGALRHPAVARSGQLDELAPLERIGVRQTFRRNQEVFAEGDASDQWYRVVAGTVRTCRLLADGRRHVGAFHHAGDFFGIEGSDSRCMSAEAVGDVVVRRYPRQAIEHLADANPGLGRRLRNMAFADLVQAQGRMLLLGRKTALERVASFLLDMIERLDKGRRIELPMSRYDIADYLGLTIETVSRTLSGLKRAGAIALPSTHVFDVLDRDALEAMADAG